MAYDLPSMQAILNQVFAPMIADNLNQRTILIANLPKSIAQGKNISWDVKVARGTSAASYASGADIVGSDSDTEVPAILQFKRIKAEFRIPGDSMAAAASAGPTAYANLFGKAIKDATRNLGVDLGVQLYGNGTGNGGLDLDGLAESLVNTGSYAGVSTVTYPVWQSNVFANGGVAQNLTAGLLRDAEKQIFANAGTMPDFIVTSPGVYAAYESLFDSMKRLEIGDRYDLAAPSLQWKGIPVLRDPQCPAGTLYMLTRDAFDFRQLPPLDSANGIQLNAGYEPIMTADGNVGLQVAIELLGKTGDAYKGFVKLYGNLVNEAPNRSAVISNITEA